MEATEVSLSPPPPRPPLAFNKHPLWPFVRGVGQMGSLDGLDDAFVALQSSEAAVAAAEGAAAKREAARVAAGSASFSPEVPPAQKEC